MFSKRNKFKFFHQLESIDCGPACLAMVASYHKKHFTLKELKKLCSITRMGVSVQDIITGAQKIGFEAEALKITIEDLEKIPLPSILYWKQDHFILLHEIRNKKSGKNYFLADPGYGEIKLDQETIIKEWLGTSDKGVAIVLQVAETNELNSSKLEKMRFKDNPLVKPIVAFVKENKLLYSFTTLLLVLGLLANWAMPLVFRKIIDEGIINKSLQMVWILLLAQFGLFLGNFFSDSISHLILTKINFKLSLLLKNKLLNKLMRLPISYFDTRLNTDTLQRLSDQGKIQAFITWKGLELILNFLNIIVFSTMLFFMNKIIFVIYIVLSILSFVWVSFFLKLRAILEYSMFLRQSENNNSSYEFIMHMPEIKINGAQQNMIDKLLTIQEKLNKIELRSLFLNLYQVVGVSFISKLKEFVTIAFCAFLIINGKMTLGSLLSITYILGELSRPIQNFINYVRDAQDADIAQKRVNDIYTEKDENESHHLALKDKIKSLRLDNVSFKYPGSFNPFVINQLSFDIPVNQITAIVGQSGSGKTTLLKLLLSYYVPTGGSVLLNGTDLSSFNAEQWRERCGVVMQDGHIFSGTIAENIAFADPEIMPEKVKEAARIACVDSFIELLPLGYNTKIGNVGIQLSGGQKQRILIARAVYKNPGFILLDEATSSLDANNEKNIMDNLNEFFIGRTVVVIAHRLSTVKNANQIIVMNQGQIVEIGAHDELVSGKKHYYELIKNQLELGN
ncbi:Mtultidrug ABC transporter permease/ATPase [Pedobacter cryoconitis]|uniref:Mtultidrug ABC transporter permease/ATPase n=1 Tax=Pedobacter cryoconitis TaxID=188932 RepID=A0A127V7X7_9SPHI|nr:peptidase domain-containing ABC transporter [Pedobacter cryoconitis]AMP97396.1 Mtultidrug ABC transporter permease/ATPase [Pedobacter cryoconitis]